MSGLPPPPQPSDPDQPGWAAPPGAAPPPAGPPPGWGTAPPPGVAPPFGGAHPGPPRPPGAPGWGPPPPGAMGPPGQYPATGPYPPTGPYGAPPPGPYPPTGPYGAPPPKGGMPGWGWALVAVGGLVGLAVVSILAITFLGESASSRFSTISSRGDSPGFVDSDAETYGDNAVLDQLWDRCEAGSGQACDDLYWDSPVGSEYEEFGNTCGRRYSGYDVPFSCAEEMGV